MTLTEMEQRLNEIVRQAWQLYSEAGGRSATGAGGEGGRGLARKRSK